MAEEDLEAIRDRRMAELRAKHSEFSEGSGEQQENRAKQERELKATLLTQVLDQAARARLANIAVAKPEKAAMIENTLVRMAQTGQIRAKMNEEALIGMLENISERTQKKTTVKFDRRRANLDDSDDDL